jgi:predicted N-formylglutamate amidohydrolase
LLGADEPAAFELVNGESNSELLLICDHASNRIPASLDGLGLEASQLASHIGWDAGAAAVARKLSARLDATLLLSNYSRLVIDCNRPPSHPESIPESSAGIVIPGNAGLTHADARRRRQALFDPYQAAIANQLDRDSPRRRLLLSIHSFTPSLHGADRPWPIGVCYRLEVARAKRWVRALQYRVSDPVGDNQPFDVEKGIDYAIPEQAEARGIPGIMLELREDRIQDDAGAEKWSGIIAESWLAMTG